MSVRLIYLVHRHIVSLYRTFQDAKRWYFELEYCRGGELFAFSRSQPNSRFPEEVVKLWAAQLITAIEHIHSAGFAHRDIKPENILLDEHGNVKLADFGFCKRLPQLANGKLGRSTTFCGTKSYMSPEMLSCDRVHGVEVDWWSLGVLLYELLCGFPPFRGRTRMDVFESILRNPVAFLNVKPALTLSESAKDLITELLHKQPSHRIGARPYAPPSHAKPNDPRYASELRAHPFFADIDWDAVLHGTLRVPVQLLTDFKPKQVVVDDAKCAVTPSLAPAEPFELHGFSFDYEVDLQDSKISCDTHPAEMEVCDLHSASPAPMLSVPSEVALVPVDPLSVPSEVAQASSRCIDTSAAHMAASAPNAEPDSPVEASLLVRVPIKRHVSDPLPGRQHAMQMDSAAMLPHVDAPRTRSSDKLPLHIVAH